VRADLAEAMYRAHLKNLKLKESSQAEDDCLGLTIINNEQRGVDVSSDSNHDNKKPAARSQKGNNKKKKK
jgi:hypothetical protein